MLNKVLLDSCSRFNVSNFPRSQKWNKYQKGSGSRVLVFLQEFWNPSFSSVMVRSQKNRSNNTQFLMKKVTYSQLSPTSCGTIFVASPRPVLCVLVSHNLRLNVPTSRSQVPYSTPVWDSNMAAVSLFWGTNMVAVTSCENTLLGTLTKLERQ